MTTKPLKEFIKDAPVPKKSYIMTKSPTKAILFSLLLPGLGQYYVESYWKVPIFVGAVGTLTYLAIDYHTAYNIADKIYQDEKKNNLNSSALPKLLSNREIYRDNRDMFIFYLSGVYILACVDAYVGVHLYDFNVTDDFSMSLQPSFNNMVGIRLNLKW
jgi:hypothetical protein